MTRTLLLMFVALLVAACATTPDCSPMAGFETGVAGTAMPEPCDGQAFQDGYRIGQALGEMRAERQALKARLEELKPAERARLRVLERDIPELETLARMEGFIAPAHLY